MSYGGRFRRPFIAPPRINPLSVLTTNIQARAFSIAGTSTVAGVLQGIFSAAFSMSGLGAASLETGSSYAIAGVSTVLGSYDPYPITSTNVIQKPVDYWLAGSPKPERVQVSGNLARKIFNL